MALRLASKIRCGIVQSLSRTLAGKSEVAGAQQQQQQQASDHAKETGDTPARLQRFTVYQASSLGRSADNESMLRQQMDKRDLQPSMLPDYYTPEIDVQHATYPISDTLAHGAEPLSMKQRRFEVSKTYANVTLPLKMPKLASPFPDPVKIMSSHTISDQEKADQMLAEARVPKASVEHNIPKPVTNRMQTRNYSSAGKTVGTDDKKCKKVGKKKRKCVKMISPGCKPPVKISCDREAKPAQELQQQQQKRLNNTAKVYQADARKKPCKDPNAKKPDKKKKKKKKKPKSKNDEKQCSKKMNWTTAVKQLNKAQESEDPDIVINQKAIEAKSKKKKKKKGGKKKRPCKKFPFDKCKKRRGKKHKKAKDDKCKKKKKPIIKGCLSDGDWETVAIAENDGPFVETNKRDALQLAKCTKEDECDKSKKKKKKMPKVGKKPKGKKKQEKRETDDPCDNRKPGSRKCPADLIESTKRRRKPDRNKKKRTSGRKPVAYIPSKRRQLEETTAT